MAYQHEASGRKRARDLISRTGHHLGKLGGYMKDGGRSDEAQDKKMILSALRQHENAEHGGKHERIKLADGGLVGGHEAMARGDRASRGRGGKGAKNHIAIIVAPQGGGGPGPGAAPPMGMPPPHPMPPPPPPMPPRPAGLPSAAMGAPAPMGMAPPGGLPPPGLPMRKAGGRTPRHRAVSTAAMMDEDVPAPRKFPEMDGPERDPRRIETASAQGDDFMPSEKRGGRARRRDGGSAGRPHMTAGSGSGEGRLEKSRDLDYCAGGRA